ncbi:hypothetical protein ACFE04_031803 [Oxalis oulophora]
MATIIGHVNNLFINSSSVLLHPRIVHNPLCSSSLYLRGTIPSTPRRLRHRCLAAAPPPESNRNRASGSSISKFQDRIRIFFAVLFWMSLFFWASAWDGRSGGRSNKGSRSKR